VTAEAKKLLVHNAEVLAARCGSAIEEGNEAEAVKLARCAAVLMKLSKRSL